MTPELSVQNHRVIITKLIPNNGLCSPPHNGNLLYMAEKVAWNISDRDDMKWHLCSNSQDSNFYCTVFTYTLCHRNPESKADREADGAENKEEVDRNSSLVHFDDKLIGEPECPGQASFAGG